METPISIIPLQTPITVKETDKQRISRETKELKRQLRLDKTLKLVIREEEIEERKKKKKRLQKRLKNYYRLEADAHRAQQHASTVGSNVKFMIDNYVCLQDSFNGPCDCGDCEFETESDLEQEDYEDEETLNIMKDNFRKIKWIKTLQRLPIMKPLLRPLPCDSNTVDKPVSQNIMRDVWDATPLGDNSAEFFNTRLIPSLEKLKEAHTAWRREVNNTKHELATVLPLLVQEANAYHTNARNEKYEKKRGVMPAIEKQTPKIVGVHQDKMEYTCGGETNTKNSEHLLG